MADVTSIYGNPIKDAVARADIATNTQDISDLKDGLDAVTDQINATLITDTASGSIASFSDGADGVPVKSLTVDIEPVQDLHGQANPYPAGGGKNIVNISTISAPSTSNTVYELPTATESGNYVLSFQITNVQRSYTSVSSVVRVFYGDGTDYYFDTAEIKRISDDQTMQAGTYPLTGRYYLKVANKAITKITFLWRSDTFMNLTSGSVSDIMLESGTSATTYAPYSNICPISGHTQAQVTRTGVNVWDEEWELGVWNGSGEKVPSNTAIRSKNYIPVMPNTEYYWKFAARYTSGLIIRELDKSKGFLTTTTKETSGTFTTSSGCYFIVLCSYGSDNITTYQNDISINNPSTDHDYHAYSGQTVTIDLDGTRYGGTLNATTGVLTVDMAIADMGTLVWGYNSTYQFMYSPSLSGKKIGSVNVLCENYKTLSTPVSSDSQMSAKENNTVSVGAANVVVFVKDTSFSDAASFKTAMSGVQLCYELAEPFTVQLTANEISTLLGQNNIWSDCGDVSVDYRADTKLYINKVLNA